MPRQQRIEQLRKAYPNLEAEIVKLVNQHGQLRTASILGVSTMTVNRWLKEHGYARRTIYEKREGAA